MQVELRDAEQTIDSIDLRQVQTIALQLGKMVGLSIFERSKEPNQNQEIDDEHLVLIAEEELNWRVRRNRAFGSGAMFGEPTWELMLDLFLREAREAQVTVTSACLAMGLPTTTALRYITVLIESGFVNRQPSPQDGRMHLVHLTDRGRHLIRESLLEKRRSQTTNPSLGKF